jgi:hypothetical protein
MPPQDAQRRGDSERARQSRQKAMRRSYSAAAGRNRREANFNMVNRKLRRPQQNQDRRHHHG